MADLEINNQKEFYEHVVVNEDGELITTFTPIMGTATTSLSANDFFTRISLNENGELRITNL